MSSHAVHDRWVRNLAATAKCDWCSQKNLVLQRCGVCHINVCHDCMAKGVLEDNQHQVARTSVNDWNWHKGPRSQRSVQSCDLGNTGNILHHENSVPSAPFPQNSSWPQPPGPYGRAPTAFPVPGNIPYGYFGGPHMAFGPGGQPSRLPPPGFFQTPYTPGYYGVQERMPQGWVGPAASYPAWNRPFIGPGQTSSQSHAQQQPQQNSTKPSHAPNPFLVPEEPVLSLKRLRPQTPSDEGAVEEAGGRPPAIRRKSENTPRETVLSGKRSESHSAEAVSLSGKPFKTGLPEKKKPSKQTLSKQTLSKQILSKQTLSAEKESSDKLPENTSCVTEHHDKDDDQPDKHVKEAAGILVAMSQGVHQPKTGSAGRKARRSPSNAAAGKMPQAGPSASSSRQALPKSSSPAPGASAGPSVLSRGPAQTARSANSAIVFASLFPSAMLFRAHQS